MRLVALAVAATALRPLRARLRAKGSEDDIGKQAKGFRQDTRRKRKKGMVKLDGPESISGRLPNTNFVELNLLPFHRETELRLGRMPDAGRA